MLEMRFYNVFAHIQGLASQENLPARPNPDEIWAWGGGTRGKGSAVLDAWRFGGVLLRCVCAHPEIEMCFYDVFAHIQGECFPARPNSSEIWAWGGGTWGEGLGLMDWRLGGVLLRRV